MRVTCRELLAITPRERHSHTIRPTATNNSEHMIITKLISGIEFCWPLIVVKKNRAESRGFIFQYHCAAALFASIGRIRTFSVPSVSSRMLSIDGTRLIITIFLIQVLSLRIVFFGDDFDLQGWSPQRTSSEVVVRKRKLLNFDNF